MKTVIIISVLAAICLKTAEKCRFRLLIWLNLNKLCYEHIRF